MSTYGGKMDMLPLYVIVNQCAQLFCSTLAPNDIQGFVSV